MTTSIEIISYNGVDLSLKQSDFDRRVIRNRRYRNRRIGEFLKELDLIEGKGTGIPTMIRVLNQNGSKLPKFDTNEPERSSFITEITIHSEFITDNSGGTISGTIGGTMSIKEELSIRQQEILNIINKDSKTSVRKLSKLLNINVSAVQKHLNTMKNKGVIKRIGSTRGHWKVITKD